MDWNFFKRWKRQSAPEPDLLKGASIVCCTEMRDNLGRETERIVVAPAPGWNARYVRQAGVYAIEVYRLKGKKGAANGKADLSTTIGS